MIDDEIYFFDLLFCVKVVGFEGCHGGRHKNRKRRAAVEKIRKSRGDFVGRFWRLLRTLSHIDAEWPMYIHVLM